MKAPQVTLDGEAWLKKDKTIGGTAYIGIVQNLVHSDRGAVYRHGGDPNGEITAEHHTAQGNKRDAVSDPTDAERSPGRSRPSTGSPARSTTPTSRPTRPRRRTWARPIDQPEFSMPVQDGPGRITSFRGHDNFKMGMAIKKDAAIHMLTGSEWSVSLGRAGGRLDERRRQGRPDQGDPGPAQGRPGPEPQGLEPRAGRGQRVRGLLDRRAGDAAHAAAAAGLAVRRRASTTRRPTRTSARRWTPRRPTSRSRSTATRPTATSARTASSRTSSATARS